MSRRRKLTPEEAELWQRVAASARPMLPNRPATGAAPGEKPKPKTAPWSPPPFALGERARQTNPGHDLLPSIADQLASQPLRIDKRMHQQMTRGKLVPESRIDLHGMTLGEAHPELVRFVLSAHGAGKRLVLVITGKGKERDDEGPIPRRVGVLRHQLPHWLSQAPLRGIVLQVTPAHYRHGGGGAFYVYLRRPR
ncbi:MAG: Smr/MutS family protein [Rhodobacteraceae bacterium]|nr:Smr/MutS family protein [Paracoccaceae bacterium]